MKKYLILNCIILAFAAIFVVLGAKMKRLTAERDKYRSNMEVLLQDIDRYKIRDSLNAANVGELRLTLSEYRQYRADDAELVKELKSKNRDLRSVMTAQLETIQTLRGTVRDSIVYLPGDTITTVYRCVDIMEPWFELHGCARPDNTFSGIYIHRDSLLIAETVQYKRFWGFLWKTRKIKNRNFCITSRNPHTKIIGFEVITIEKK